MMKYFCTETPDELNQPSGINVDQKDLDIAVNSGLQTEAGFSPDSTPCCFHSSGLIVELQQQECHISSPTETRTRLETCR